MNAEIILRDVIESDLPIFYEQQLDPEANTMAAFPPRDRQSFMTHWVKIMADNLVVIKAIIFDGQVAGNEVRSLVLRSKINQPRQGCAIFPH